MITKFLHFLNESHLEERGATSEPMIEVQDTMTFHLSDKLTMKLNKIKNDYTIAKLLLNLKDGVNRSNLVADPVNYLDVDEDGNISFLKSRFMEEARPDYWGSKRRQKSKASKILRDIYNEAFINSSIKQTDVEGFVNQWALMNKKGAAEVVELRGDECVRAYDLTKELDKNFGFTCANNHSKDKYDIYTKNPDSCGICVVIEDGIIKGRRSFQQGIQVENNGCFNKGEFYTVYGNYYGVGGSRGRYDNMIVNYLKETYNAYQMHTKKGSIIIPFETRFARYCPFDGMRVCFSENLLSDIGDRKRIWEGAYGAQCPDKYVRQRKDEEARGEYFRAPHAGPRKAPEFPPGFERDVNFFKKGLSMI
jgi:hypothetical protein